MQSVTVEREAEFLARDVRLALVGIMGIHRIHLRGVNRQLKIIPVIVYHLLHRLSLQC